MEVIIAMAAAVPLGTLILGLFTLYKTSRNGERVIKLELDNQKIIRDLEKHNQELREQNQKILIDLDTCYRERTRYADLLARELAKGPS